MSLPYNFAGIGFKTIILILGSPDSGRTTLAKHLSNEATTCLVQSTASEARSIQLDYVILTVNMTSAQSFRVMKDNLELLGEEYFAGRCCIVASKVDLQENQAVSVDELKKFLDTVADVPVYCGNLQVWRDKQHISSM
ncbi:hypothetical protein HDU67_001267 [Dinochytrium kinnereticum]|nr:hypothetical protein HDU67_001267 [Dinochytrium kinnereticum]